jgi:hypothetical protein
VLAGDAPEGRARRLLDAARGLAVVAAGAALAIGYWYRPIFVHHGATSAHYTEWNGGVSLATLDQQLAYARTFLVSMVRVDEWPLALRNALFVLGIVALWRTKDRTRFLPGVWIAMATFVFVFHYFVTMPALHSHFVPDYVRRYLWVFAAWLVAAIPVTLLLARVRARGAAAALQATVVGAAIVGIAFGTRALDADSAIAAARQPPDPVLASLQKWVKENTRPDDVVLSANELSFAWSALTGRKTMVTRRAQNDPFVDMDVRNRDAALVLYGSDDAARERLLRQYGVRYVLWTDQWIPSEYWQDPRQGVSYVDPLLYFRNEAWDDQLTRAGVKLTHHYGWVDPALRGPEYARFELTLIGPENYRSRERPWREALDARLEKVWSHEDQGREVAVLYAVRL